MCIFVVVLPLTVVVGLVVVKQISCYYDISDDRVSAISTLSKWIVPYKNTHYHFLSHTMQCVLVSQRFFT